jgi:hypothetical protein
MAFLSLLDIRAKPAGSRDPLGFELVWSHFGRKVIGNLTTITSSMDNFAVAVLGFYWANQLVSATSNAGERHNKIREMFLRYEQLTGYVRYFGNAKDIMGITRVKARVLDESFDITLGTSTDEQILSDQASYGLWGLYSSAARDTGLIEGNDRVITINGERIARRVITQLGDKANLLLKLLRSEQPLNRDELESIANVFMNSIRHSSVRELLLHALMSGSDPTGVQSELWSITQSLFESNPNPPENVGDFILQVLNKGPSSRLKKHLDDIVQTERILVATNNVFNYCRRKDGANLSEILGALDSHYVYVHLPDVLPGDSFPRRKSLERILFAFHQNDASLLINEVLSLNKDVMKHRSGAAWVEVEGGKTLRVKVRNEKAELRKQQDIEERWDYDYFLGSFLNIARNHFSAS